jgi:aminopeptidase S
VGTPLDSPAGSPGVNSEGSGAAALLELAIAAQHATLDRAVRFGWWSSHEAHAQGSSHYMYTLSPAEVPTLAVYLDASALASTNGIPGVLDGNAAVVRVLRHYLLVHHARGGTEVEARPVFGTQPFAQFGVPVGGVFGGTDGVKTWREAVRFGGRAGAPYDACYSRPCDDSGNLNRGLLALLGAALGYAVGTLAAAGAPDLGG